MSKLFLGLRLRVLSAEANLMQAELDVEASNPYPRLAQIKRLKQAVITRRNEIAVIEDEIEGLCLDAKISNGI